MGDYYWLVHLIGGPANGYEMVSLGAEPPQWATWATAHFYLPRRVDVDAHKAWFGYVGERRG